MATLGNKLIVQQLPWHANMTELNHLGANLSAKPYAFEGVMKQLFSASNIYASNPLSSLLFDMGSEKTITQLDWEWQLRGADNKPLVVVENIEPAGKSLGKGRTTFRIKLDQNWYVAGDVITPLNGPKKFQCRIMEEPQRHGTGWVYTVRLKDDDFNASLPGVFLEPGQEWGKLFSEYEEAAEQSGSTQYSMPLSLTDHMNKFRKKYKITDYAGQEVLAVKVPGPDGQLYDSWIKLAEATFWKQKSDLDMALTACYGTMTKFDDTGYFSFATPLWDSFVDNGRSENGRTFDVFQGNIDPSMTGIVSDVYLDAYVGIARMNLFLYQLPKYENSDVSEEDHSFYEGQVLFLRAFYYCYLSLLASPFKIHIKCTKNYFMIT